MVGGDDEITDAAVGIDVLGRQETDPGGSRIGQATITGYGALAGEERWRHTLRTGFRDALASVSVSDDGAYVIVGLQPSISDTSLAPCSLEIDTATGEVTMIGLPGVATFG